MYFFFCLDTKEKDTKKKKSRLHFLATPLRNFRGQKELATLKQQMLRTLRLSPSRTFTRLGLDKNAKRSFRIANTVC